MIKVYEAIRQNNARLVTNYCGVAVVLNFVDGNIYAGKNATLRTNDRFVQDAIENDVRFGVNFKLKSKTMEPSDEAEAEMEQTQSKEAETGKSKPAKGKNSKVSKASGEVVESVKTLNDAIDYFAEKGELLESADQIDGLCGKYGVSFPNLSI